MCSHLSYMSRLCAHLCPKTISSTSLAFFFFCCDIMQQLLGCFGSGTDRRGATSDMTTPTSTHSSQSTTHITTSHPPSPTCVFVLSCFTVGDFRAHIILLLTFKGSKLSLTVTYRLFRLSNCHFRRHTIDQARNRSEREVIPGTYQDFLHFFGPLNSNSCIHPCVNAASPSKGNIPNCLCHCST